MKPGTNERNFLGCMPSYFNLKASISNMQNIQNIHNIQLTLGLCSPTASLPLHHFGERTLAKLTAVRMQFHNLSWKSTKTQRQADSHEWYACTPLLKINMQNIQNVKNMWNKYLSIFSLEKVESLFAVCKISYIWISPLLTRNFSTFQFLHFLHFLHFPWP